MTPRRTAAGPTARAALLLVGLLAGAAGARADEPVVTTLADYEDDSVVVRIADVENVLGSDCAASMTAIPARGQRSLMVEIGATERNASAACDLRFRLATLFDQASRVATYAWIKQGSVEVQFRVRDTAARVFETPPITLRTRNRWERLVANLSPGRLTLVSRRASEDTAGDGKLVWPIQIQGYRIRAHGIGRQTIYLDDLEVEHRASGPGMLRGEFKLDKPTHIYEPGALVRAAVVLENISRRRALPLSVQLAWLRSDGSELTTARQSISLPASGGDFRSRQPVDFSKRITEPGLYRLVARVRGPRWTMPAAFETTIAVTPTNRALPRGRDTFFGVQTNLMREPLADQLLELDIAREIGVQLLALETPWRAIEPRRDLFDFATLDELINLISQRDIATMIILTDPPECHPGNTAASWERQAVLFETLAKRYGKRICAYQPLRAAPGTAGRLDAVDLAAVERIRERITRIRPDAEVIAPPISVVSNTAEGLTLPRLPPDAKVQLAFETTGDPESAATALEAFATRSELSWTRAHRWFHRAEALTGSGTPYDAVAVLRHYVQAARAGVAGVVWFDLRDDTNDVRHAQLMNGLVRRDFSPKTPLLGLANTIGQLAGLLYAGQVPGTPAEFESALFIGGQRQVALLFPKPNRVLPAALAPYQIVPGELSVLDFDRRPRQLVHFATTPLLPTIHRPLFITLNAQRAQAEPKLGLARPWLRAPATVYCASETTFRIELDAPADLRHSYLQLILPSDSPVKSSLLSRALRGKAGDTLSFDVTLTRTDDHPFEPTALTIRLRLAGASLQVPVALRPLFDVRPMKSRAKISNADFVVGQLTPPNSEEETQPGITLHIGYQSRKLHIAVRLPPDAPPNAVLQLGVAAENADTHAEAQIEHLTERPALSPARSTTRAQIRGWRCHSIGDQAAPARFCHITIPARSLQLSTFEPDTRLLLAVRYRAAQPGDWTTPVDLRWGAGLDGARSTARYHWVRLVEPP